jgi:3-methyladenine DNA glycosylase/8-oxoguanine DNA glycosylase
MDGDSIMSAPWFPELFEEVKSALSALASDRFDARPGLEYERAELESKMQGWAQSLGNPTLPPGLRTSLEANYAEADQRHRAITAELVDQGQQAAAVDEILDPQQVVDRLNRLDEVLAAHNPTRANLERSDPIMGELIGRVVAFKLNLERSRFWMLVWSIISQQLSTCAARAIRGRIVVLRTQRNNSRKLSTLTADQLRSAGLSKAKAIYVADLTDAVSN